MVLQDPAGKQGAEDRALVDVDEHGGGTAFITDQENVERGLAGETGTHVVAWRQVRGEAGRG